MLPNRGLSKHIETSPAIPWSFYTLKVIPQDDVTLSDNNNEYFSLGLIYTFSISLNELPIN